MKLTIPKLKYVITLYDRIMGAVNGEVCQVDLDTSIQNMPVCASLTSRITP